MRVRVSSRGELSLTKLDEFDRFDIEVAGDTGRAEVALALAELGQPTDDLSHVFVEPAWVVRQGGERSRAQEWRDGWEAMAAFAAAHGWTDDRGRIRAHVTFGAPR